MAPEILPDFVILLISLSILTQASPTRNLNQNNTNNYTQDSQNASQKQFESQKPLANYSVEVWTLTPPTLSPEALHYIQSVRRKRDAPPAPRIQRSIDIPPVIDYYNL